jgi:hypothetical protein
VTRGITCQSTRTPCSIRALRALWAQVAGYLHVMWHWPLMSSLAATARMRCARVVSAGTVACLGRSRRMVALLGVALSRSGESLAGAAGVGARRRHGFGEVARRAVLVGAGASASARLVGARAAGLLALLVASGAMPPFTCLHRVGTTTASHNKSANTDRVTAGFACLRASGCLQR